MRPDDGTKHTAVVRFEKGAWASAEEPLTVEAPLHIRLNDVAYTTTMRTPGDDEALARGLLFTEGIVPATDAPCGYRVVDDPETGLPACVEVSVPEPFIAKAVEGRRTVMGSASCGVCGTRAPEDIEVYGPPLELRHDARMDLQHVAELRRKMQEGQDIFRATGGCHAAAIFSSRGELLVCMEDIGRHNAVDKAVGWLLSRGRLGEAAVLFVSGRVSYEIVYKAYRAGVPIVLAVSAVSSLAVETAERLGITLVGYCRDERATVYSRVERFTGAELAR